MHTTHTVSLAVSAFLLLNPGCILEELNFGDPNYPCSTDFDCVDGYRCDLGVCLLIPAVVEDPPCDDQDDDGYGCGEERTGCRFAERDTDCVEPEVFPDADDICDGKDNDSDGTADEPLECTSIADCPRADLPGASFFRCIANTCVLKPSNTSPPGCDVELSCVDGAYEDVPETCT